MFSETRYALNGDLHVAYRASREGPRDIVLVANWFTCCDILPELPSLQGWVEAMTSLGRLIFFDQPGTGVIRSRHARRDADVGAVGRQHHRGVRRPRQPRSGPRRASVRSRAAALFAATYPSRTTALVALDGYADAATVVGSIRRSSPRWSPCGVRAR